MDMIFYVVHKETRQVVAQLYLEDNKWPSRLTDESEETKKVPFYEVSVWNGNKFEFEHKFTTDDLDLAKDKMFNLAAGPLCSPDRSKEFYELCSGFVEEDADATVGEYEGDE